MILFALLVLRRNFTWILPYVPAPAQGRRNLVDRLPQLDTQRFGFVRAGDFTAIVVRQHDQGLATEIRLESILASLSTLPSPRITVLENILPWRYRSCNRDLVISLLLPG